MICGLGMKIGKECVLIFTTTDGPRLKIPTTCLWMRRKLPKIWDMPTRPFASHPSQPTKILTGTAVVALGSVLVLIAHRKLAQTMVARLKGEHVSICWMLTWRLQIKDQGAKWIWTKGWLMDFVASPKRDIVVTVTCARTTLQCLLPPQAQQPPPINSFSLIFMFDRRSLN